MGGDYCCKTQKENVFMELDYDSPVDASQCNAGPISLSSVCCEDNAFTKCPNNGRCKNGGGSIDLLYHLNIHLSYTFVILTTTLNYVSYN